MTGEFGTWPHDFEWTNDKPLYESFTIGPGAINDALNNQQDTGQVHWGNALTEKGYLLYQAIRNQELFYVRIRVVRVKDASGKLTPKLIASKIWKK